jgi:CII-binding regulator of phage lambda lysogenization HflD
MATQSVPLHVSILPLLEQNPTMSYAQIVRLLQRDGIFTSRQRVQQIAEQHGLQTTREQVQLRALTRLDNQKQRGVLWKKKRLRNVIEKMPEDMQREFFEAITK